MGCRDWFYELLKMLWNMETAIILVKSNYYYCIVADAAKIYIEDQGDGFNWQEELEKTASCDIFDERGRGIYLAKIFCDNLMYNEKGNKVCLIKKKNLAKDKGVS